MTDFYYIVHATTSDNVGTLKADSEEDATAKLNAIYMPDEAHLKSPNISFELITLSKYKSEGERISKARLAEANFTETKTEKE